MAEPRAPSSDKNLRTSVELMYDGAMDGSPDDAGYTQRIANESMDMEVREISRKSLQPSTRSVHPGSQKFLDTGHVALDMPANGGVVRDVKAPGTALDPDAKGSDLLDSIPTGAQVDVVFQNINAWVPLAFKAPGMASSLKAKVKKPSEEKVEAARKQILHKVSASCSPGELLALMGPSGSGKTSLLTVLGDRQPKLMTRTGSVLFNGQPMNKAVKRRVGFVLQDDLLHETLTVYETLRYIALLRLPKAMSTQEKEERALGVMKVLGISKQRDTLVGGRMQKGVSGGERKRVSVGTELLINPAVLFLDEPTSGLDASTALKLVETLRQLASGGRTVITTIHQPSSRLYATMDSLILLAQGHVMYFGKANLADRWFSHLGYPNPGNFNLADYVLDLAANAVPLPESVQLQAHPDVAGDWDTISYLNYSSETFLQKHQMDGFQDVRQLSEVKRADGSDPSLIKAVASGELADGPLADESGTETPPHDTVQVEKYGATWAGQFLILMERSIKSRRLDSLNFEKFLQVFLVGLLAGLFWWQSGQKSTIAGMADFQGAMFFILVFPTFGAVFAAIFTFPTEYALLRKERASGMYKLSAYYLARTTADLPLVIIMPSLFFNLVYWLAGFAFTAKAFFFTWFAVFIMVLTGDSAGLWIGAMAMDARRAQTFVTVFMLSQFLVAGFFVRNIPVWIGWARYISFMYWGYSLITKIQLPEVSVTGCSSPTETCTLDELKSTLRAPRSLTETKALDVCVVIAFFLFFRLITYMVLARRTRK